MREAVPGAPGKSAPSATAGAAADGTGAAPQQGVDYSGTNVQETGVDEPDMVKTDGNTLFTIAGGQLQSVDVTGKTPNLLDTLKLDNGWSHELLLSGNHLLVLSRGGYWIEPMPAMAARMMAPYSSNSVLTEVDVSDPKALKVVKTLTIDGAYVDARMVGSTVRIVSSSSLPLEIPFATPAGSTTAQLDAAKTKNQSLIAHSRATAWLPTYKLGKQKPHAMVQCRDIRRPIGFSGLGMLTVMTIDLAKGLEPIDSTAVMTDGRILYASPTSLYVATEQWSFRPDPATPNEAESKAATQIHAFDISNPMKTTYLGSGTVPRLPAQPVVALRVPGRPARRQHRHALLVGRRERRKRVVPDDVPRR